MEMQAVKELVNKYFCNSVDKGGNQYQQHLYTVAERAKELANKYPNSSFEANEAYTVGLLHDILEDTDCTEQELIDIGCNDKILNAIKAITRRKDEEYYFDFIKRVSENELAKTVKIADLENNMDITRLNEFGEHEMKRLKKYWYSWKFLRGELSKEQVNKELEFVQ